MDIYRLMLIFYRGFINKIKIYYTIKVSPEILLFSLNSPNRLCLQCRSVTATSI